MDTTSIQGTPAPDVVDEPTPFAQGAIDALTARVEDAEARASAAEQTAAEAQGKTPVYAVYDKTYERYTGPVHASRAAAEKAGKALKTGYRIDEVYR